MEYSITFFARGVWGSFPIVTISDPGPVWTIFSTSSRIFLRSMSRFLSTLAATPDPSLTRPRRMCSVPMYSWLNRWASWLASCITLRARSVKRSYIEAVSDRPAPAAAHVTTGGRVERCPGNALPGRRAAGPGAGHWPAGATPVHHTDGAARVPMGGRGERHRARPRPTGTPVGCDRHGNGSLRRRELRVENQGIIVGQGGRNQGGCGGDPLAPGSPLDAVHRVEW